MLPCNRLSRTSASILQTSECTRASSWPREDNGAMHTRTCRVALHAISQHGLLHVELRPPWRLLVWSGSSDADKSSSYPTDTHGPRYRRRHSAPTASLGLGCPLGVEPDGGSFSVWWADITAYRSSRAEALRRNEPKNAALSWDSQSNRCWYSRSLVQNRAIAPVRKGL